MINYLEYIIIGWLSVLFFYWLYRFITKEKPKEEIEIIQYNHYNAMTELGINLAKRQREYERERDQEYFK